MKINSESVQASDKKCYDSNIANSISDNNDTGYCDIANTNNNRSITKEISSQTTDKLNLNQENLLR